MDGAHRDRAFPNGTGDTLDRPIPDVAGSEHSGHTCLEWQRRPWPVPCRLRNVAASCALPKHPITPLASGTINQSGDMIEIVLIQPDSMPPMIRIGWPLQPSMVDPRRFPDTASIVVRMFAEAATRLANIKAHGV